MIYAIKVKEVEQNEKNVELLNEYPLLWEYKDVFPNDLLGMPPK